MERVERSIRGGLWLPLLLLVVQPFAVAAQQVVPPDTVAVDTVVVDTVAPAAAAPAVVDTIPPALADTVPPAVGDPELAPVVREDEPGAAETEGLGPIPQLDASADSVLQALRNLPGYTVTEYQGQRAVYTTESGILRLLGEARVSRAGDRLSADTIEYRDREEIVTAFGNARVVGEDQDIEGHSLFYDLARRRATALGARTQITEGATWYVSGDVTLEGTHRLFGSHAHFTSCDLEIPHYHFESDQVMVLRDRILVARPARLYFGNVPVMVLPFVVQSLERGRRSGLLTPRFGMNDIVRTSSGYTRQVSDLGFYWAMSDYMDSQLAMEWRSGAYTALMGNLNFNWRRQFLNGRMGLDRYWREDGRREFSINSSSSWQPDERTQMSFTGRYASSSELIRDVSFDPRDATQDLMSTFSLNRRFDWGRASLGADRRQSIATGDVSMTLPTFSISPAGVTLFRAATPEQERWYSNASFTPGVISGSRATTRIADNILTRRQDQDVTRLQAGPSFSVGNFSVSANGTLNRSEFFEAIGFNPEGESIALPERMRDEASWSTSASYRQQLIGTTSISPNIAFDQQLVRDTITGGTLLGAPTRMRFGAGLNTDLYGFYGGFGGIEAIRHRLSPRLSYSYSPEVRQNELQEQVFGRAGGRAQNRISLDIGQTWEGKLREPVQREEATFTVDTISGDTIFDRPVPSVPTDPQKVTILSLTTSPLEYDFIKAREEGSGFVTQTVSSSISSDYLRGLTIQMQHELFDRSEIDPRLPENTGNLGRFAPRMTSLSTSFELGPHSSLVRWIERFAGGPSLRPGQTEGVAAVDGAAPDTPITGADGTFTGNPLGTGGGPWRVSLGYQYSRPLRTFVGPGVVPSTDPLQALDANMSFQLSPNWSVNWATSYSITDRDFGAHRLNFRRDLHEWQANFSFYQTPYGASAFEFSVELLHNRDLRFDHRERNLGVDRRR